MAVRVDKPERQRRLTKTQDCWNQFVEKFFVGGKNFLFPERKNGEIFTGKAIDRAIAVLANAGQGGFNEAAQAAFKGEDDSVKYLFSHAVFVYELIITSKSKNVKAKEKAINCLNLDGFADSKNLYLDGCSSIGEYLKVNRKPAIEYVLRLFKHLSDIAPIADFNGAIESFCEGNYKDNKSDIESGIVNNMSSVILWYVAPNKYEPISAQSEKEAIANYFAYLIKKDFGYSEDMLTDKFKVNEALRMIRQKLEAERGEKISFYDSDVEKQWRACKNERGFKKWLTKVARHSGGKKKYKPGVVKSYVDALKGAERVPKFAKRPIYGIESIDVLDGVMEMLFNDDAPGGFKEADSGTSHRTMGSALKRYREYLLYRKGAPGNGVSSRSKATEKKGDKAMPETKQTSLNQIFYGPPGTGKTYGVVEEALKIVGCNIPEEDEEEGEDEEEKERKRRERRKTQMDSFNKLRDAGQIAMITFHENFAYEEFIEGIKPVLDSDDNNLSYEMAVGIFKEIAKMADENRKNSGESREGSVDVEEIVEMYAEYFEEDNGGQPIPIGEKDKLEIKDVNRKRDGQFQSFVLSLPNGKTTSFSVAPIKRNYELLMANPALRPSEILPVTPSERITRGGNNGRLIALLKELNEFDERRGITSGKKSVERKNYVLIIDEINRGNLSRIFGELITLIESDKRLGQENELRLTLPYSKEDFGVPDNLYIIGTMNTADRSTTKLDTALRRRFHFVEMMPDPEKAAEHSSVLDVDCGKLLKAINRQIRLWRDREHQIGHTYFMGLKSIDDLKDAFQDKIIPLLQEYFFSDWGKIDLALNKNGFIVSEKVQVDVEEMMLYEKLPSDDPAWKNPAKYRKIYGEE